MPQRRLTATDQLSTVVDALQLGKKTGILAVERGEGQTFEEGTITLVHGQVVQAVTASYLGREATAKLFSWKACFFSFFPMLPEHISQQTFPTVRIQATSDKTSENRYKPFYGAQQAKPATRNDIGRRPLITLYYKNSMSGVLRNLEQRGFSRTHRRLFLLIDGHRSIEELASLIGRTPDETTILLAEMEQAGFIQL